MENLKHFINTLRNHKLLDMIGDPISIQDSNLRVLYQNQSHKSIVGDRVGEYCYHAYQGRNSVCEGCHLVMSFKDGKVHTVERSRTTETGIMYSENTSSALRNAKGEIIAGIEVVRDVTIRKLAELALKKTKDELEDSVKERTKELEEMNTALKILLQKRENDRLDLEKNILSTIKHLVLPYTEKLKKNRSMSEDLAYLSIIESNLNEIISPFAARLSSEYLSFTPKEIQIANLIKDGKQDKEIMEISNISSTTVKYHRQNIRKKLNIYGKRINLRTYLLSTIK